ncbi:MAG: bifunctional 2-polyprenyl-6-hydroxyphenol methylase/3-demethylubiquinol 3-O-methyltransferase UbiG [Woeseiaceae bacterium]|nr:bifunctional 2-polyprenyl-6-hydroxyphenol methylase/3-demethylubiquinol 3-O-methyltransferase UbiG [Woeseiaceae bacterium]
MTDTTIDAREVEYYSNLADSWWDTEGPFRPLHAMNAFRVTYLVEQLTRTFSLDASAERPLAGLRILDVGCGGGILSESMARLGADVTGIDVVERNIAIAKLHAARSGLAIDYRQCEAGELADTGATFDVVLNMEVVEHVADLETFMSDCGRLTRPGGVMAVSTINRTPKSWVFAIVGAEYILRLLPRGTHRWSMFRKPDEIESLLDASGLAVDDITGVAMNPMNFRFRLTSSLAVNYMLVATRG